VIARDRHALVARWRCLPRRLKNRARSPHLQRTEVREVESRSVPGKKVLGDAAQAQPGHIEQICGLPAWFVAT